MTYCFDEIAGMLKRTLRPNVISTAWEILMRCAGESGEIPSTRYIHELSTAGQVCAFTHNTHVADIGNVSYVSWPVYKRLRWHLCYGV